MAEALVKDMIKNNPVVVFSKTYCPFCTMAKETLKDAGLQQVIIFSHTARMFQDFLKRENCGISAF